MRFRVRIIGALGIVALLTSCQRAAPDHAKEAADERQQAAPSENAAAIATSAVGMASSGPQTAFAEPPADDLDGGQLISETWDAISMQGRRVGYARNIVANVKENGRDLVRTSSFVRVVLAREGQRTEQAISMTSWDTMDGKFVRFESRMESGLSAFSVSGAIAGGQLLMEQQTLGQRQSTKIPWSGEWGGPFAVEQSLRQQPLKAGQARTVHGLLPVLNVPGDVRLQALSGETVELPGGPRKLLKVRAVTEAGQQQIEELRWIDERGEALKSVVPSLGQEAIRTTKEDALRPAARTRPLDIMAASVVPITGRLIPSATSTRAVYRARVKSGNIAGLFKDCPSQRVKTIDEQTAELTVLAIRPNARTATTDGTRSVPTTDDLQSNGFIQSDDRLITQMAAQVAPRETDSWKNACALESFVRAAVKNKNYSQAFATAADVARTLEGDCTEHSLLLAALCRSRKIPTRAAFGLIYYPPQHGFAYHMWNEVWVADRWVAIDSTLGLGGIGADHIKLGDSNFSGTGPMADLLTVAQAFGRLELEVLEVE